MFVWRHHGFEFVLFLILLAPSSNAISWPFPPKRFTGKGLIAAGSLGLSEDARALAFGDFNGDQFLDIVTLDASGRKLTVHLWDHDQFVYRESFSLYHTRQIYNVIPGDFTHNGSLDLLVMSRGDSPTELAMDIYIEPLSSPQKSIQSALSSSSAQPIALDVSGNLKIDLLGMVPGSDRLTLWKNIYNASRTDSEIFSLVDAPFQGQTCSISNPHSNAIIDFDGDCLADVFLVCDDEVSGDKYYQIWKNNKGGHFTLAQTGRLPKGSQTISFADMNRDGTMDMVFATCDAVSASSGIGSNCAVNIAYNQQLPLCTSKTRSVPNERNMTCREPDDLCAADPHFYFDLEGRDGNIGLARIPISDVFPDSSLVVADTRTSPSVPLSVRLGDANLDGFPDILFITASTHGGVLGMGSTINRTPRLMQSVPCSRGVTGCDKNGRGRVGWQPLQKNADALNSIVDACSATFVDVDDDGTLDIIVQRNGEQGEGPITFIQNNFFYDAFFLKAIVLNGACENGWCSTANGTGRYHPFGVSYPGATYKYTVLDMNGRRSAAQVAQLPQSAYQSLLTPYAFFGLGRTNNYIENFFAGSTLDTDAHYMSMEGVIPNSKIVLYPPSGAEGSWRRELYLRPGAWIPWVTVIIAVTVVLLAIIVFVLHLNEKREDELERRKASHHINFDAL